MPEPREPQRNESECNDEPKLTAEEWEAVAALSAEDDD